MVNTHWYTIKYNDIYNNITWAMVNAQRYAIKYDDKYNNTDNGKYT